MYYALCEKAVAHQGDVILRRWCAYDVILKTGQPVTSSEYHQSDTSDDHLHFLNISNADSAASGGLKAKVTSKR